MPSKLKRLIGAIAILILVIVYAIGATLFAATRLADYGAVVHLAFFAISGLLWILPAMVIIRWMMGPKAAQKTR